MRDLLEIPSRTTMDATKEDGNVMSLVQDNIDFKESVCQGDLGKTAQLRMSYTYHIWLILDVTRAVKYNDYVSPSKVREDILVSVRIPLVSALASV